MNNDMHLPNGTLLQGGKYKIVRFISSGGFGCTYEAEHVMLEKKEAIKEFFVKDFCNRDETTAHVTVGTISKKGLVDKLRGKFIDEAKALSRLQHPNIVRVSDVFEENGTAYFVMDYIDGSSLGEIVKREGSLSEQRTLKYIRQVAEALRYVHDHNRLHLDVKPGNIMIDGFDNAVLIDFGASKQYDEADGENTSTLMGKTPGYAPLEQMGNNVVKFMPATDIYALGATAYKLLTGITPLGANLLATGEELAPLPKGTSKNVAEMITSAMQIRKAKRPQNIAEFLTILNGSTVTADKDKGRDDEATILNISPKEEPKSVDGPKAQKEGWIKKLSARTIVVAIICGFALAFIVGSSMKSCKKQEAQVETEVVNKETSYNGERYSYTGPVNEDGNAEGEGEGVYSDGTYQGEYVDGCREGQGRYVTKDHSNVFEGTFEDDKYHEGRLTLDDGSYFEGTFYNNEFDTGTWYNPDGSYDSEMVDGEYV